MIRAFKAGTRASNLARTQTRYVIETLQASHPEFVAEEIVLSTKGDEILDKPLAEIGGKGLFTEELERALRDGAIDFAVHSLKDLPTDEPDGIVIGAIPPRVNPRDAFVSPHAETLRALRDGARIGTSSLRRKAQLRAINSTWEVVDIRGNVETRLGKIDEGIVDAVILAAAGLERLGKADKISEALGPELMLPACGQGALAIQVREDDEELREILAAIHDENAAAETAAERAFLAALGGGCQVPIGASARVEKGRLSFQGCVCSLDGTTVLRVEDEGPVKDAAAIGRDAALSLIERGADRIVAEIH